MSLVAQYNRLSDYAVRKSDFLMLDEIYNQIRGSKP